jgi:CheY-like chemotaxis protein
VPKEKYRLFLVEDSEDDALLFAYALKRSSLHEQFEIVRHFQEGNEALEFFKAVPPQLFDILILDLKLPGKNGFDMLASMGERPGPIVGVFTTSILEEDRQRAEALGADLFQTKIYDPAEFSRFLSRLGDLSDKRRAETLRV